MILSSLSAHEDVLKACLTGDDDAWREFKCRYDKIIALTALRTARRWDRNASDVVRDLVQDTYSKLCAENYKRLREFQFRNEASLFGFLKVVTANLVHDYFRKMREEMLLTDPLEAYETMEGKAPRAQYEIERNLLLKEVDETLNEVTGSEGERDRTIFWLHYRQGFSAKAIAELHFSSSLGVKGVESALHRLREAVRLRLAEKIVYAPSGEGEKGD